jgi:two-component system LytT family response regulator
VRKWLDQYNAAQVAAPSAESGRASASPDASGESTTVSSGNKTRELLETAAHSPSQQQRVVVKTGGKIKIIPVEDIHYLEASDDYVKIHTHNGAFLKNKTMNYFEQVLDSSQFVRTHRSYILNVQQVTRIDPYEKDSHLCILQSGASVPVSKSGYVKLKTVLGL